MILVDGFKAGGPSTRPPSGSVLAILSKVILRTIEVFRLVCLRWIHLEVKLVELSEC